MLNKDIIDFLNNLEKDNYSYQLKTLHECNSEEDDTFDSEIVVSNWKNEKYVLIVGIYEDKAYLTNIRPITLIKRREDRIKDNYRIIGKGNIESVHTTKIKDGRFFVHEEVYEDGEFEENLEENKYFLSDIFKGTNDCQSLEKHLNNSNIIYSTHVLYK